MVITSNDYEVISCYALRGYNWRENIDTLAKVQNLIEFSEEVADIFIRIGANPDAG